MPKRDFAANFPIADDALIFSQSTVSSLELSPCRWYYGTHQGIKLEPSEAMFFGTVEHAIVEAFITGKINHFELISPQTAQKIAYEVAEEDGIDLDEKMPDRARRAAWFLELAEAAQAWYHQYWTEIGRDLDIISVEEQFAMNLGQYPAPKAEFGGETGPREVWFVTGGIDLVHNAPGTIDGTQPVMVDWKTAGRGWSVGQGTGNQQKEAYAMLYENKYGVLPVAMTFAVYNRMKHSWSPYPAKITRQSVDAYRLRLEGWINYMLNPFHLCTPSDGKRRGWWAKPDYNDVIDRCPSCRHLGDEWDNRNPGKGVW